MAVNAANGNTGFFNGATDLTQYLVDNGKALQKAETEAINAITEIDGAKFFWNRNTSRYEQIKPIIPDDEPVPDTFAFFTLEGLVDYITENTEGLISSEPAEKLIVRVGSPTHVALWSQPSKYGKKRSALARCEAHIPEITFGRYMDTETFNTMLLSKFIETEARATLFTVVKSLTKKQDCNVSDDGVSQVLTVKQGVSLASNTQFQNPVPLKPMRTFAEINQPESNFTLRVNEDAESALFEADGGAWKNIAVGLIKDYLRARLIGCNVAVIA